MRDLMLTTAAYPPRSWSETVIRGVDQHNVAATGLSDYYPVGFLVKNLGGEVLGGLLGDIWGGWLHVRSLWVNESIRSRGYTTELMARAHQYALDKSCTHTHLQTGSYEARPLYEALGYNVYAELEIIAAPSAILPQQASRPERCQRPAHCRLAIAMDLYPSKDAEAVIRQGITTHAYAAIGLPEKEWSPHNVFCATATARFWAECWEMQQGDWMYIARMGGQITAEKGHATKLMAAAEEHAVAKRHREVFLDTFSFQARPLYEKLSYQIFGEEKDHPKGHSHYLLKKRLA